MSVRRSATARHYIGSASHNGCSGYGRVIEDDGDDCILTLGTDDLDWAARWLVYRNLDVDVLDPPELSERLHALGRWLADRYGERTGSAGTP